MRALLMLVLLVTGFEATADDDAIRARGRELTAIWLAGDIPAVWAQLEPGMQRAMRDETSFAKFRASTLKELGTEVEVLSERLVPGAEATRYERVGRWSNVETPYVVLWEFAADGKVAGFGVMDHKPPREPAPSKYLDYATKAPLRLPFDGEWLVYWGGRTVEQNYHIVQPQQRFAYDLTVVREGRSHRGEGTRVEDYYCWDQPIRAPAGGTVIAAVGDVPDQKIGSMDKARIAGNHVILDLGNSEYALFGHLRNASVRVKPGDVVKAGDEIGRCGNSGNTSEPHLHFHLQDSPRFGEGEGLPAFFVDYVADGKPVARGEPVRGQAIRVR